MENYCIFKCEMQFRARKELYGNIIMMTNEGFSSPKTLKWWRLSGNCWCLGIFFLALSEIIPYKYIQNGIDFQIQVVKLSVTWFILCVCVLKNVIDFFLFYWSFEIWNLKHQNCNTGLSMKMSHLYYEATVS